ncbi:hypothetical protein VFPPC_16117 [Pochonia chlamydosporia 170]|uniref:Uncharacterized protein n=1 Tax=Pochonia chlamydosporia 170 TaxID=1380566 RepID=A0A179FND3_METCM|nr:hypothetical protein VFPPC_16117 [Pochonia chlamydosporia 170]OAQ67084.1 hypothetical protein VFPPC_16117 [Pochonia chlamydosporia 170]
MARGSWRKHKQPSRSTDFNGGNQRFQDWNDNRGKNQPLVPATLGNDPEGVGEPRDTSHGRQQSLPQNTLQSTVRGLGGEVLEHDASTGSTGGNSGSLKVPRKRKNFRKPNPFYAKERHSDDAGMAQQSSTTAPCLPVTSAKTREEGAESIESKPSLTTEVEALPALQEDVKKDNSSSATG